MSAKKIHVLIFAATLLGVLAATTAFLFWPRPEPATESVQMPVEATPAPLHQLDATKLEAAINGYRATQGLKTLSHDSRLCVGAQAKLDDMIARQYYEHETPDGKSPFSFTDIPRNRLGENLMAVKVPNETLVMAAWVKSPAHNTTMLDDWDAQCVKTYRGGLLQYSHVVVSWFADY